MSGGGIGLRYLGGLLQEFDLDMLYQVLLRLAAVLLCLTVHETSHGLAAYALGDSTAKRQHRLSLNPLHHIDWFGLAAMMLCGFGWAKPVPVDPRYFKKPKQGMALTALAGPVSNFILAFLLLLGGRLVLYHAPYTEFWQGALQFLLTTAMLSVGLGVFNLIPLPPLDGSKVAAVLLPDRIYDQLMRYESLGMVLLAVLVWLGIGDGVMSRAMDAVFRFMMNLVF